VEFGVGLGWGAAVCIVGLFGVGWGWGPSGVGFGVVVLVCVQTAAQGFEPGCKNP